MPTHIVIPDERAEQLRQFAASLGVTVSEAVGILINDAIVAGKIPDTIPGLRVERIGDQIKVDFGAFAKSFNRDLARQYASQIRALIGPMKESLRAQAADFGVTRRGSGIKLTGQDGQKTVAPSVAEEIARLIEGAASDNDGDAELAGVVPSSKSRQPANPAGTNGPGETDGDPKESGAR